MSNPPARSASFKYSNQMTLLDLTHLHLQIQQDQPIIAIFFPVLLRGIPVQPSHFQILYQ